MKYILGVIALFMVTIFAILLVTRGHGTPKQPTSRQIKVSQRANLGTAAVFTTEGRLVGETERRSIRIRVSRDERRLEILTGYEEAVDKSFVFPNTQSAYQTFLIALDRAGFTTERQQVIQRDERGACPLGRTYVYEFKEYSQQLVHLWDTSCGPRGGGTFGGITTTTQRLFQAQIPEYSKHIKGVKLY